MPASSSSAQSRGVELFKRNALELERLGIRMVEAGDAIHRGSIAGFPHAMDRRFAFDVDRPSIRIAEVADRNPRSFRGSVDPRRESRGSVLPSLPGATRSGDCRYGSRPQRPSAATRAPQIVPIHRCPVIRRAVGDGNAAKLPEFRHEMHPFPIRCDLPEPPANE